MHFGLVCTVVFALCIALIAWFEERDGDRWL